MTLAGQLRAWAEDPPAPVDGAVIDELRALLDAELGDLTASLDPDVVPLRLPKRRLADVLACERYVVANMGERPLGQPAALGLLLHRVLAHVVRTGTAPADPLASARDALEAEHDQRLLDWLDGLDEGETRVLASNLAGRTDELVERLGAVDPDWWPQVESPAVAVLAGGRVMAAAAFDLVLGGPVTGAPRILVELKAGATRDEHRQDLFWYALLAALRDGYAPHLVATLSVGGGSLVVEPVGPGTLRSAAYRALDAAARLARLAAGGPPATSPGPRCRWCVVAACCETGTAWLAEADRDPYGLGPDPDEEGADPW